MKMRFEALVIGASAGAIEALSSILPALSEQCGFPVIIVVHLPPDKKSLLAEVLQAKCTIAVREIEDKEPIEPGRVYIAPPDYHVLIEQDRTLSLSSEEPVLYSRPSIDVTFESAADVYGESLLGVVLTGANSDGARGLKAVTDAGGTALVQEPKDAYSKAMPQAALAACHTARALSLSEITAYIKEVCAA